MKRLLPVLMVFGSFIALSSPSISSGLKEMQTSPPQKESPEKMIEDGMKMILGAIELFLKSIPEYKAPEVLENGDIIIRRVPPHEARPNAESENKKGI